jgi:anti-sigma-K factor RskA
VEQKMTEHDDIRSLVAPYALGALPEEEIRFVRGHILECEECMAEADDYLDAASSLSLTVAAVEPPPGFADRVLAQATESQRQTAPVRKPKGLWRLLPAITAGALAVMLIGLTAIVVQTRGDLERNEKALVALLQGDQGVELRGEGGAVARVVPTDDGSTLIVAGLTKAPNRRIYQLWFLRGTDKPVSAGIFDVSGDLSVIELDRRFDDYTGAAVSVEPEGGSDQPMGEIVAGSA